MSVYGQLESFDPARHNFERYAQRFEFYVQANGIEEEMKKSVFLILIGYETSEILANMYEQRETQQLEELIGKLTSHFHPKSSVIAERYQFGCRRQGDLETIADYVADLKKLATRCIFKKEALDETLRHRFVCGL